jgi:hypothetical protein
MAADNIVANGLAMFNRLLADKSHELVHIKKCSPTDADGINPIDPEITEASSVKYLQINFL